MKGIEIQFKDGQVLGISRLPQRKKVALYLIKDIIKEPTLLPVAYFSSEEKAQEVEGLLRRLVGKPRKETP